MNYLIASTLENRFIYEAKIQLFNFQMVGIDLSKVYYVFLLVGSEEHYRPKFNALKEEFPKVNFFLFYDHRDPAHIEEYGPTCRPHMLRQFFDSKSVYSEMTFCYMDSDCLFTRKLDDVSLRMSDLIFGTDTYSYTSPQYIMEKGGQFMLADMTGIVGVPYNTVADLQKDECVGAQYILKEIDGLFWNDVEIAAYQLHLYLRTTEEYYKKLNYDSMMANKPKTKIPYEKFDYNPIQKFCADMWAVQWVGLKRGKKFKVHSEMNMVMATDEHIKLEKVKIYHNNGIVNDPKNRFNVDNSFWKHGAFKQNPFALSYDHVDPLGASSFYVNTIKAYIESTDPKFLINLNEKKLAAV